MFNTKKALICIVMALVLVSALAVSAFAYGMGGTKIYNSSGAEIGSGYIWNQPNNSPYTLGGSVSAKESSTLTVVLIPRGINLSTGATDELIATSPLSKSNRKTLEHTYTVNSSLYYPTLARATFIINGSNSATYQYSGGWNWG